jgi:glycine cleavage system H protein
VLTGDDGQVTVGITDHAQELLGDMVFVELPEIDRSLEQGEECSVVESVKAASDVYAPLAGTVVAVNENLADTPELINEDPYGDGWMFRLQLSDAGQLDELLDADAYAAVESEE